MEPSAPSRGCVANCCHSGVGLTAFFTGDAFSWFLVFSFRSFFDFFFSSPAKLVEDLTFLGLFCAGASDDGKLFLSACLSLPMIMSFKDTELPVFLCIVGLEPSCLSGTRMGWGGLLMCRSPRGLGL